MALIPIVQNLHDEFVLFVSMVDTDKTMDEICEDVAKVSIGFDRNREPDKPLRVRVLGEDEPLPRKMTVAAAEIAPMTSLEFFYETD